MKFLVLGANGFLGSHVADELLTQKCDVRCFFRPSRPVQWIERFPQAHDIVLGDFTNPSDLEEALSGVSVAFLCIGTSLPSNSNKCPIFDIETSILPTVRFLEMCVKTGVKKVVFISSGGTVYGIPQMIPIPEGHPENPINAYGISRVAIEKYLALFHHLYGLEYCIFRLSNPYGERQNPEKKQGVISTWLWQLARKEASLEIWGDGKVVRDFIYVKDAIKAIVLGGRSQAKNRIFNVGSGEGHSLLDILNIFRLLIPRPFEVIFKPSRTCDAPLNILDLSRAKSELNWSPCTALTEGIEKTWKWIQTQLSGDRL